MRKAECGEEEKKRWSGETEMVFIRLIMVSFALAWMNGMNKKYDGPDPLHVCSSPTMGFFVLVCVECLLTTHPSHLHPLHIPRSSFIIHHRG